MNADALHILADGTEEMIKLIFGAVFVLIWIVGGLMSATAKKKPKTQTPEKSWDEIFRELSGDAKRPQQQQQQQPPPPPPPVRVAPPPPRSTPAVRRPTSEPTIRTNKTSGPPSGPAVRKKLRRKQRTEVPIQIVPPPPPPGVGAMGSPVLEVATESLPAMPGDISKSEIGAGKAKSTGAANTPVKQLHAALRPENLRHQFILTEILQPPKALRDEL
jgi:hypothetical protein